MAIVSMQKITKIFHRQYSPPLLVPDPVCEKCVCAVCQHQHTHTQTCVQETNYVDKKIMHVQSMN